MKKIGFSRRRFMKTGMACLAGAAVGGRALRSQSAGSAAQAVSRTSLKELLSIPTTCRQCPSGCGILAHLDGDRCVQVLGNPAHPVNQGSICAKGIAGLNLVYDPERLLFPLKRIGRRGEGAWTRITWDEAYQILHSHFSRALRLDQRIKTVFDMGHPNPLLNRFVDSLGGAAVIDRQRLKHLNLALASWATTGSTQLIPDIGKSRTILNFGANPLAHHDFFLGLARRLMQARVEDGAKLFTFDVRMSETAAKSTAWFPVRAGTDGAIALSMAHVILKKGLADRDFISKRTNTTWQTLEEQLAAYSQKAEEISGVKSRQIEEAAITFATQKPSVAIAGGGVADHANGVQNVRCVLLLNWLIGNFETEGGLHFPTPPSLFSSSSAGNGRNDRLMGTHDLIESGAETDLYFSYMSNPVFAETRCQDLKTFFRKESTVRFTAVVDTHMTETALLADLVLPAAAPLESWGLEYAPSFDRRSVLSLQQPAVSLISPARVLRSPDFEKGKITEPSFRPLGEAKDIGDVCIGLARRLGGPTAKSFPFKSAGEFFSREASKIPGLSAAGGMKALQNKGLWIENPEEREKGSLQDSLHLRKISIVSESEAPGETPGFPVFKDIEAHKNKKNEEFVLTTYKTGLIEKSTANSKWLREIFHENLLWINRRVAKDRGIATGDRIRISSSTGSLITRALVTDRIHPESVALAGGFGHTATGNIARAKKSKTKDRDTLLLWWNKTGQGVNPNEIISVQRDASSGAYISKDTLVQLKKI